MTISTLELARLRVRAERARYVGVPVVEAPALQLALLDTLDAMRKAVDNAGIALVRGIDTGTDGTADALKALLESPVLPLWNERDNQRLLRRLLLGRRGLLWHETCATCTGNDDGWCSQVAQYVEPDDACTSYEERTSDA